MSLTTRISRHRANRAAAAPGSIWRAATLAGTALAVALTAHTVVNTRHWRTPPSVIPQPGTSGSDVPLSAAPRTEFSDGVAGKVSLCIPMRDEAENVQGCLASVVNAASQLDDWELIVLDDQSNDNTKNLLTRFAAAHPDQPLNIIDGTELPAGWLGKPWACAQLAERSTGDILVFLDADVRLERHALAAAVTQLRDTNLDLVSPYPRQIAVTWAERLIQPLLQWTFLTTLPLRVAERGIFASMVAANGQFLVVDKPAYGRAGGHTAIRDQVLDDVELLRAIVKAGGCGVVTNGTTLATCRMYHNARQLRDGYGKSLWTAFGPPAAAASVAATLALAYIVPACAALAGSRVGAAGYAAAVAGRVVVARASGQRIMPDAFMHPLSVAGLIALLADSHRRHHKRTLSWRGRPVSTDTTR